MKYDPDDMTTWLDGSVLARMETLRAKLAAETHDDVRVMLAHHLDTVYAEIRRRNRLRIEAVAAASMS